MTTSLSPGRNSAGESMNRSRLRVIPASRPNPRTNRRSSSGGGGGGSGGESIEEVVEKTLMAVEGRQAARASSSEVFENGGGGDDDNNEMESENFAKSSEGCFGGPLTATEISKLNMAAASIAAPSKNSSTLRSQPVKGTARQLVPLEVTSDGRSLESRDEGVSVKCGWASVDGDSLAAIVPMLEKHVASASHIDLVGETRLLLDRGGVTIDEWLHRDRLPDASEGDALSPGAGFHRLCVLRRGLEAATVLLSIMTSPSVDKRAVSDDAIDACVALVRHHLFKNIIHSLSGTGHHAEAASDLGTPKSRKKKRPKLSPDNHRSHQQLARGLKKVYRHALETVGLASVVMEWLKCLIETVPLDDQPLISISSAALSTLTIDPLPASQHQSDNAPITRLTQTAALGIVSAIFRRYPRHRSIIIEDLFPLMLQLPTSKRSMRIYPVSNPRLPGTSQTGTPLSSPTGGQPPSHTHQHIQFFTALLLSLVQSCVEMPHAAKQTPTEKKNPHAQHQIPRLTSGLRYSLSVCDDFTKKMILRCARKAEDGGASEFRPILANLTDDLLLIRLNPYFPASDMLLLSLCRRLSHDLLTNSSINGRRTSASALELTYLSTALDTLGKVCASLAANFLAQREKPFKLPKPKDISSAAPGADPTNDATELNRCFCGRTFVDTFMLDCDRCHSWFHGSCVGVTRDSLPDMWVCDDCTMQLMVIEQTKAFSNKCKQRNTEDDSLRDADGIVPEIDEAHIFRQLLLNYLSRGCTDSPQDSTTKWAKEFHLAQWIRELDQLRAAMAKGKRTLNEGSKFDPSLLCAHFLEQWNGSSLGLVPTSPKRVTGASRIKPAHLSTSGTEKVMTALAATKSDLATSFPRLLGVLVGLMGDEDTVAIRKLAVKAISQVVEVDPKLMTQPSIRTAVACRFRDEAISVREAAVSLVGSFVLLVPAVAEQFHSALLERLGDDGLSVRKSAVRIFRDILVSNPNYPGRAVACIAMCQRVADPKEDEGVKSRIRDVIAALLGFDEDVNAKYMDSNHSNMTDTEEQTQPPHVAGSFVPDAVSSSPYSVAPESPVSSSHVTRSRHRKTGTEIALEKRKRQIVGATKLMVEIVATSGNAEFLTNLLKDLLFAVREGKKDSSVVDQTRKRELARSCCTEIVEALMEQLVKFEELRAQPNGFEHGPRLVALISVAGVFAEAHPPLLLDHLDTLLPYLKADNGVARKHEATIVGSISRILCRVAPALSSSDLVRMDAVCDDLVNIVYKFNTSAMSSAIEALAQIAGHRDAGGESPYGEKLLKLALTFYRYLFRARDVARDIGKVKANVSCNIYRALSALGYVCRNDIELAGADLEEQVVDYVIDPSDLHWSCLSVACYSLFIEFLQNEDTTTKCKALRAMCGIFISHPRLLLAMEQSGLIESVMSTDHSPSELQLESLYCWREVLLAEEKRVESGEAKEKMDSMEDITVSKRISGDQDGDASLVGGVFSQHSQRLFRMTASRDTRIRYAVVDFIGHLLRQGLINPMETVPHLLALQGDVGAPETRSLALRLLIAEGEKRPDMLRHRVRAGIKQSYNFQRRVYPGRKCVTAVIENGNKVECIFGKIFKESVRKTKALRLGLYQSLLSLFGRMMALEFAAHGELASSPEKKRESKSDQLPLLSFAAQVLAHLPYNNMGDLLFIIYHISCSTALQGQQLIDRMAAFLRPHKLSCEDEYDAQNNTEDALELAADTETPSTTKAGETLSGVQDIETFCDLCTEGSSIVLLLRLRNFLCDIYNISEGRIIEYVPSEKERISDRGLTSPAQMPKFNSIICSHWKYEGKGFALEARRKSVDVDVLIRQYAEFRQLMRTIEVDNETGEEEDKTPTNHSERKRKSSRPQDHPDDGEE